jgi:hypothetical protein
MVGCVAGQPGSWVLLFHIVVWLPATVVLTFKTFKACNYVRSVLFDVGLPDMLVSNLDTSFTSALRCLLDGSARCTWRLAHLRLQHHCNSTSKVERVHGIISDVLRAFLGDCGNVWPEFVPLAETAINDSETAGISLNTVPRLQLSAPAPPSHPARRI